MRKPTAAAKGRRVRSESSELHIYGYDIYHSYPARTLLLAEDAPHSAQCAFWVVRWPCGQKLKSKSTLSDGKKMFFEAIFPMLF